MSRQCAMLLLTHCGQSGDLIEDPGVGPLKSGAEGDRRFPTEHRPDHRIIAVPTADAFGSREEILTLEAQSRDVLDNVSFGLRRAGTEPAEIARRVAYAIGFMGLDHFADAYPAQLSGGMRQRVCIARTLVMQPRLILLDEPFGALDQQTRLLMGDELLRLWRETRATVLLITHALDEAALLSDRIGVMSVRPGRFIDLVSTGWERNRDSRIASDPGFGAVTARLWAALRPESIKAMGRAAS